MTTRSATCQPASTCLGSALRLRARWMFVSLLASSSLLALVSGCNREPSLEEIRALQAEGRYAETVEPLRHRLESTPDDPETHFLYGTALSRTGAARVAIWSLRKAAETAAWKVPATLELSSAQSSSGNWQAAIDAASAVIEAEPDNLPAYVLRGEAYLNEGEHPEHAIEDFDFVLDQDPTNRAALSSRWKYFST